MKGWSNSDVPGAATIVPEKRLLAAVLQRAITDFLTGDGELKEGSKIWLFDDKETDAPLGFSFVCEALDLDKDSLRLAIIEQAKAATASLFAANEVAM